MVEFSKEELEAAQKAISSSIRQIEKAYETLSQKQPPPKPQLTLATRNLQALRLSLALITREKERYDENDAERLAKFEDAYRDLQNSISELPGKLETLRTQGKEKTVTYKELLAQKLINNSILQFFEKHGIGKNGDTI